ncbi:hypothetical protein V6C27_00870 [Peptococcaceae bacterium 1198_IL3148]
MDNLDEDKLGKLLLELYNAQKQILFQEMMVEIFMKQTKLTEGQMITVLKAMLEHRWLVADAVKEKMFLRPGFVLSFPVVISSKGLDYLKSKGLV